MNHYFDDILHRYDKAPTPRLRRSSTSRSMGARSDFFIGTDDADPYAVAHDDHDDDGRTHSRPTTRPGSVYFQDPERARQRSEADQHLHHYISEQLERIKNERSANGYGQGDEFEAQADANGGGNDERAY